jgi:hypothetical protein
LSSSKGNSKELSDQGERGDAGERCVTGAATPMVLNINTASPEVSNLRFAPKLEGGAFILDIRHNRCYSVNQVGLEILRALSEGQPEGLVIDTIALRFATISRERIEKDVRSFSTMLRKTNLL